MSGRVIVVGSVNVDLVVRSARLPLPGETLTGGILERHHGGKGANQAVAAARLGASTVLVAAVGHDDFGEGERSVIAAEGVDVSHTAILTGETTGIAVILVDERGENMISVASGANRALSPEMVAAALDGIGLQAEDVVLACNEIPLGSVQAALRAARRQGACAIFNPAPAGGVDGATLGLTDYLTPNESEADTLAHVIGGPGLDDAIDPSDPYDPRHAVSVARSLLADEAGEGVARAVVVTLGARGALLARRAVSGVETVLLPAHPVAVVDTTGAGDAFNGALAASLTAGFTLVESCQRAIVAAGLATTRSGAREGMPDLAELELELGRLALTS